MCRESYAPTYRRADVIKTWSLADSKIFIQAQAEGKKLIEPEFIIMSHFICWDNEDKLAFYPFMFSFYLSTLVHEIFAIRPRKGPKCAEEDKVRKSININNDLGFSLGSGKQPTLAAKYLTKITHLHFLKYLLPMMIYFLYHLSIFFFVLGMVVCDQM